MSSPITEPAGIFHKGDSEITRQQILESAKEFRKDLWQFIYQEGLKQQMESENHCISGSESPVGATDELRKVFNDIQSKLPIADNLLISKENVKLRRKQEDRDSGISTASTTSMRSSDSDRNKSGCYPVQETGLPVETNSSFVPVTDVNSEKLSLNTANEAVEHVDDNDLPRENANEKLEEIQASLCEKMSLEHKKEHNVIRQEDDEVFEIREERSKINTAHRKGMIVRDDDFCTFTSNSTSIEDKKSVPEVQDSSTDTDENILYEAESVPGGQNSSLDIADRFNENESVPEVQDTSSDVVSGRFNENGSVPETQDVSPGKLKNSFNDNELVMEVQDASPDIGEDIFYKTESVPEGQEFSSDISERFNDKVSVPEVHDSSSNIE